MSAYVIFIREGTVDQSALDAYAKATRPPIRPAIDANRAERSGAAQL
jgi:hypothetical protein